MKFFLKIRIRFILLAAGLCVGCLTAHNHSDDKVRSMNDPSTTYPVYWYERDIKRSAWIAADELAVFPQKGRHLEITENMIEAYLRTSVTVMETGDTAIFLKLSAPMSLEQINTRTSDLDVSEDFRGASPVFYSDTGKKTADRFVLTGEILVQFHPSFSKTDIDAIETAYGLQRVSSFHFAENTFLYTAGSALKSLETANIIYESGHAVYAYPNRLLTRSHRSKEML